MVLSIIAGLTSLVPIYFQLILVKGVMGNTGQYYSLAVVAVAVFFHFNAGCLRMLLLLPAAKYLDVDLIAEAFYYVPYLITSQIIIFGDIVFLFLQVGVYACIVLSIYVLLYIVIAFCAQFAFDIMRKDSASGARRKKS